VRRLALVAENAVTNSDYLRARAVLHDMRAVLAAFTARLSRTAGKRNARLVPVITVPADRTQ
jgi:hypothetical protein